MDSQAHSDQDRPAEKQDSPAKKPGDVLEKACLMCGGDLVGARDHYYVCTACNLRFSEENLIRAGKLKPRKRGKSEGTDSENGNTYYKREVSRDT